MHVSAVSKRKGGRAGRKEGGRRGFVSVPQLQGTSISAEEFHLDKAEELLSGRALGI